MELIDLHELSEWILNWIEKNHYYHPFSKSNNIPIGELNDILNQIPRVDAVPVKHGKWVTDTDGRLHCSNCANIPINRILFRGVLVYEVDIKTLMKFCPKCGAIME